MLVECQVLLNNWPHAPGSAAVCRMTGMSPEEMLVYQAIKESGTKGGKHHQGCS